jgi:pyruvate dehydrogenase (quinone)
MTVEQAPGLIEQAVNTALAARGVAVLSIPGDVGGLELAKDTPLPRFVAQQTYAAPSHEALQRAAEAINTAASVTLLVGRGARDARDEVMQLAERLAAPMVLTLKAKEGFDDGNDFEIGQSGLIGNHATKTALDGCDVLIMLGTDFPYREFFPSGKTVVQLDVRGEHIGRRTAVDHPLVGDCSLGIQQLLPLLEAKSDRRHLDQARSSYDAWRERQQHLTDPDYDTKPRGLLRRTVDNPEGRVRPELVAAAVDRHAHDDAVFTSDTGMSTVWLSRFVRMTGSRRLVGSYNLGSMANAMPQALGAAGLDRSRQVVAFCGDGGLSMLMGDLITAVSHDLPVKLVVFDNGRLGMVKLEMEQVGLPEYGTELHNPDFAAVARSVGLHGVRVTRPGDVDAAVREALEHEGPVLLDVLTNPDEIAVPPHPTLSQGWGFAIAKSKEFLESHGS